MKEAPVVTEVRRRGVVADMHTDTANMSRTGRSFNPTEGEEDVAQVRGAKDGTNLMNVVTLKALQEGNYTLVNFNSFPHIVHGEEGQIVPKGEWEYLEEFNRQDGYYNGLLNDNPESFEEIRTGRQLRRHTEELRTNEGYKKIGVLRGVEGFYPQGADWERTAKTIIESGVRIFGLVWNRDSDFATGTTEKIDNEGDDPGLTDEGKKLVRFLATRKIMPDLSHSSPQTMRDTIAVLEELDRKGISHADAIVSHAASREITKHRRNIPDDIAKAKGIAFIGIPFVGVFLESEKGKRASVSDAVRHIAHFKEIGVIDKVGIGSDFNGTSPTNKVDGLSKPEEVLKSLSKEMSDYKKIDGERYFTDDEINGVLYENAERVLRENFPSTKAIIIFSAAKEKSRDLVRPVRTSLKKLYQDLRQPLVPLDKLSN